MIFRSQREWMSTHRRPKPKAIVEGSRTVGSICPFLINRSGMNASGSGYITGSCSIALFTVYGRNSVRKLFARRIKPFCSLRGTSCHFEFCAAHQTDLSDFATLKASLNFALRHRPRVKLPLAILGGISSNKYGPRIEL